MPATAKVAFALASAIAGVYLIGAAMPARDLARPPDPAAAEIDIDPSKRFQTVEGWEVTIRGWEQNKAENRYDDSWLSVMPEIVAALVDDAGVNRIRLEVRSNAENPVDYWTRYVNGEETHLSWSSRMYENVNDNKDPFAADPKAFQWSEIDYKVDNILIPVRDRLAARGEKLSVTLCLVDFSKGNPGTLDLAARPEEYAELIAETFSHLKEKYDLTPDALEIVLEPENSGNWRAERIGPAIRAAVKRLAARGFHPRIIGPSTKLAKNAIPYFNAARRAGADIDVISYHSYDNPSDDIRRRIAWQAEAAGASTAMLEHLNADANEFYRDMTIANVSAWQQWAIAHVIDNGKYLLVADLAKPQGERIQLAAKTRPLAQIWRHARIGDMRVAANSDVPALKPLAFVRPDGGVSVSVIAEGAAEFTLRGLPAGDYSIEYTTPQALAKKAGAVSAGADGRARLSIPARGVITIFPAAS